MESKRGRKRKGSSDPDLEQYGKRFVQIREKMGYTSYEIFAYDKGLSRVQYGRMEAGENITIKTLAKYLKAIGMSHKEFFSTGFN